MGCVSVPEQLLTRYKSLDMAEAQPPRVDHTVLHAQAALALLPLGMGIRARH